MTLLTNKIKDQTKYKLNFCLLCSQIFYIILEDDFGSVWFIPHGNFGLLTVDNLKEKIQTNSEHLAIDNLKEKIQTNSEQVLYLKYNRIFWLRSTKICHEDL